MANALAAMQASALTKALTQQHSLIREPDEYTDLFALAAMATTTTAATVTTTRRRSGMNMAEIERALRQLHPT